MVISLCLIGMTLLSLGVFYYLYKEDVRAVDAKLEDYSKVYEQQIAEAEKKAEQEAEEVYQNKLAEYQKDLDAYNQKQAQYQKELDAYNAREAEEQKKVQEALNNGKFYYPSFESPPIDTSLLDEPRKPLRLAGHPDYVEDRSYEFEYPDFKMTLIIHSIIVGFIVLVELGLLLVLPKRKNVQDLNVNIKTDFHD